MKKIAMLSPYAPSYREGIYTLMDKELKLDWYFCGNAKRPLKLLDYSCLNKCNLDLQEKYLFAGIDYYKGFDKIDFDQYDYLIIAGVIRCITEWRVLFRYANKKRGPKVFLWTHGYYGYERFFQGLIKKFFYNRVDGLFLYGNYAKEALIREGIDAKKLYVIHNSLDYDVQLKLRESIKQSNIYAEHFCNNNPTIIFIGRLTKVKKLDQLLEAVSMLNKKGREYNVVFVGDGEERNFLGTFVANHNLQKQVWFYGACFDEKKNAELVYNADLCVAPGNIGLTAMHALMFGCPAMSHNDFKMQMPEFESIKPGITGDFFNYDDVEDMAKHISQWFAEKKEHREEVRQACYKEIDDSWNPYFQVDLIKKVFEID